MPLPSPSTPRPLGCASSTPFACAFVDVLVGLWRELERLPTAADPLGPHVETAVQILQLELALLHDSVVRLRTRGALASDEAARTLRVVDELRSALDPHATPLEWPSRIAWAQDHLLAEIQRIVCEYADRYRRPDGGATPRIDSLGYSTATDER